VKIKNNLQENKMKEMENVPYDEIKIGMSASVDKTITQKDIQLFAYLSGDINPVHLDESYATTTMFKGIISHGMIPASLISNILGTKLPGIGTIYLKQSLKFTKPVKPGDTIKAEIKVSQKDDEKKFVTFDCTCTNQNGVVVLSGESVVMAPTKKEKHAEPVLPVVEIK